MRRYIKILLRFVIYLLAAPFVLVYLFISLPHIISRRVGDKAFENIGVIASLTWTALWIALVVVLV